jgi:hypothetical protein
MTPQERQLVDDLFDRLAKVEGTPRDPDALAAIAQGLRSAPNAVYALVQTVLLQDEALKRANHRIQELEAGGAGGQPQSGGFLDSMRETVFGQSQTRGSVPNVPKPEISGRPVWNTGQALQQAQSSGQYGQGGYDQRGQGGYDQRGQGGYDQPYGGSQAPMGGGSFPGGGGGGSFLGTAAAAAAGMVGGSLLLGSIRSMMGGGHHGFGDAAGLNNAGDRTASQAPLSDQSGSNLARDAGIDSIGSSGSRADSTSRAGLFDTASNDDDHDDMDADSDDFDGDGDSDTA